MGSMHARGFTYYGVQFTNDCWCGDSKPVDSAMVDSSECDLQCPGDSTKVCGGVSRMNVYGPDIGKR